MERRGFIHDMLDVKILILYVMDRVMYPGHAQKIYELCYQDDCLSYFDVVQAIPQMVASGHLLQQEDGSYAITEEGKQTLAVTADSIAFPVRQRAENAVERFNRQILRNNYVRTEILPRPAGDFSVVMGLDDEFGNLMTLELVAPTRAQARKLEQAFSQKAEQLYQSIMNELLASEERAET
ncbi:MAG: DUF4364 family protein [Oscillospiraceae bacterium]